MESEISRMQDPFDFISESIILLQELEDSSEEDSWPEDNQVNIKKSTLTNT